jgi:uncharacterized repeat protein (TIGR01451 family)
MRNTRSVIVSGIVLFALFLVFWSAEASPSIAIQSDYPKERAFAPSIHSEGLPTAPESPDADADLSISILDDPDPVAPGSNMAYTIVITNTGPSEATGVKITDTLPTGVSYLLHVPSNEWTCTLVGSELRCSHPAAVPANSVLQLGVGVSVSLSSSGVLSNLVRVGASTYDPVSTNNSDTETTTVVSHSDLSITKVESSDPVIGGTNLTYTLTVSNTGPSNATSLVVTDTLPANITYQSYSLNTGWTCALLTDNQLRCTRSGLLFNNSSTFTILTRVNPNATGSLSNTAVVRSASIDDSLTNNTVTIPTTINTRADLSVTKTDSPDPVAEGQTLTYKVVVKNNGPSDATGVLLNESIPAQVTYGSAVPVPQGTCTGSGPVTCSLGTLAAGKSITVTVTTTAKLVANVPKLISNTAAVSTTTTDPISANNTQTITTQVLPAADLKLNLESSQAQVNTGSPLTYTLWITNTGPSIATNVVVTDTLPIELTYKSSSLTPMTTSPTVSWSLGDLAVGQSMSFRLVVNVKSPTQSLINTAIARSSTWDIYPANNQDQTSVQAIDAVAPTVTWELPVHFGERYDVSDNQIVRLEVFATDNVAVSYVRFYRWDTPNNDFVDIGFDYTAETCQFDPALQCYQWDLDTSVLNLQWNEIRARAYDGSGNPSPSPSLNSYIFLYRTISYTLTYTAGAGGTITAPATSPSTHNSGDPVTITAAPNAGYHFVNWTGDVSTVSDAGSASTIITMYGNYAITANFAINTYTLTADNDGHGTVKLNPAGGTYTAGTTVTLTPLPSAGYKFNSWSGANAGDIVNTAGVYTIVMNENKSVSANFTTIDDYIYLPIILH